MWSLHAPAVLFNMHDKIVRCKLRTLLGFHGFMFKKYFHEADYCLQMCIVKVWRGLHIIFTPKCKHHCLVQNNVEVDNDDKHIPVFYSAFKTNAAKSHKWQKWSIKIDSTMEYASCDLILACFGPNSCGHSPTGMPLCNRFNRTSSALEASTEPNSSLKAESHTIEVEFSLCKKT